MEPHHSGYVSRILQILNNYLKRALKYRPSYLSTGLSFDIITNEEHPYLPWTCRLPSNFKNLVEEPMDHPVGIEILTAISFGIRKVGYQSKFTDLVSRDSNISFQNADEHHMTVEFDHWKAGKMKKFRNLPLTIKY